MDNKVYSAFFRELQPYNFSQIKEIESSEMFQKVSLLDLICEIKPTISHEKSL